MRTNTARLGLLTAALLAGSASGASAQNFFAALFGGSPYEGRSAYGPASRGSDYDYGYGRPVYNQPGYARPDDGTLDPADPRLQREIQRRRAAAKARRLAKAAEKAAAPVAIDGKKGIVPTPDAPQGSLALFMKDRTLRAGDVVVTSRGFLVYQGSSGHPTPASFVAINGSDAGKAERSNLLALERVSAMRTPNTTIETIPVQRDFIGPRLPEQQTASAAPAATPKAQ